MKRFKLSVSDNPTFNTVTGLSNTTFDPTSYVSNRGATEGQVKVVHDMIKALQDWLDENGCSNDPYAQIRAKVNELEAAIDDCCANPQDALIQALNDRLDALEDPCSFSSLPEQSIGDECDGNEIELSLSWDNPNNPYAGGKVTATSSMSDHSIVKFYFQNETAFGTFPVANVGIVPPNAGTGGRWKIDNSGNLSTEGGVPALGLWRTVVAEDDKGCKGIKRIYLPGTNQVVAG